MKKLRPHLPPLGALAVFETVLRSGSFTAAADRLNVTQAAVSKRIRGLEEALGCTLFERRGRRIEPTAAGRKLGDKTASALDYLEEACAELTGGGATERVTIAANAAVSHFWLAPALRDYMLERPQVPLTVATSDWVADQTAAEVDLAILYGTGTRIGWRLVRLFEEALTPVAAPALAETLEAGGGDFADRLAGAPRLDYERVEPDWITWPVWLEAMAIDLPPRAPARLCAGYAAAIAAACRGEGVVLGALPLLRDLLSTGQLVALTDAPVLRTGRGYFIAERTGQPPGPEAARLRDWLLSR